MSTPTTARAGWTLSPRQAQLIALLIDGSLEPLRGPLTPDALATVRSHGHLPDGTPWRGEAVLAVDAEVAASAAAFGALTLRDEDGTVLAELTVEGQPGDPEPARNGPEATVTRIVGGVLTPVANAPALAFPELHVGRTEIRRQLESDGPITVAQPTAVPDVGTLERWRHHLDEGGRLLIQPRIEELPHEVWAATVRAHLAAARHLPPERALVQLLPLPGDEMPDAASLRAVVAANHGARTLLDAGGVDHDLAVSLGLQVIPSPTVPTGPWHPDVQVELDHARAIGGSGVVVLLTGLSGSGKSTIARALRGRLLEQGGRRVTLLDGDLVRRTLSSGLGFSAEDRATNVRRIGWVAAEIARHGGIAICAPIAPEDRVRRAVRADVEAAGGRFVLVHVATALEVCEQRDSKGLYARARAGELTGMTGIDAPYDEPSDADLVVDTATVEVDAAVDRLMAVIEVPSRG